MLAAHAGLLLTFDLVTRPLATSACLAAAFAGLALAGRAAERAALRPSSGLDRDATILGVAAILRLLLLPLPPTLSEDSLRYLWDGKVVAAGFDPYRSAPDAALLAPLRDERWDALPHKDVATVYPPLALLAFSISARLPAPLLAWKALASLADLGACFLLLGLARRAGAPPGRVVWYAWSPLATLEVAGMGHVEGLAVAAAVAAVAALARRRPAAAAAAAAGGVLTKLAPLLALPMWCRQSRRAALFGALAGGATLAGLLPMFGPGMPPGLVRYGVSWEFNGPLYEPLWRTLEAANVPEAAKAGLDRLQRATGEHDLWNRFYPYAYGRFLAKLLLAAGLATAVLVSARRPEPVAGTGSLFGAALLASATVYPWYVLWVLPWAALCRHRAWLLLSGAVLLAYLPRLFGVAYWPGTFLAIWVPFFALLAWRPRWSFA